jgi:ABC-type transport system involved in Fe-S cluster assembly fused permease/ATPase subunit
MLMLLRMYEVDKVNDGKILIDGLDISTLGLHQLRKAISIIPQDGPGCVFRYHALQHTQLEDYVL